MYIWGFSNNQPVSVTHFRIYVEVSFRIMWVQK